MNKVETVFGSLLLSPGKITFDTDVLKSYHLEFTRIKLFVVFLKAIRIDMSFVS